MAKRKYNIKGTNDFIVLAGIFFFLCLWAIKDAWYPSEKVMNKHPQEIEVSFETSGAVEHVQVAEGDPVAEEMVLATLRRDHTAVQFEDAKNEYTESKLKHARLSNEYKTAKEGGSTEEELAVKSEEVKQAKAEMDTLLKKVNELRLAMEGCELVSPSKGEVKELRIKPYTMVEAGETAVVIDPKDHFYLFNKSLAVFSFFSFWIFLAVHILAR